MTGQHMHLRLSQVGAAAFEATAGSGGQLIVDGAPDIGGEGRGMRPMELLLAALSSCSAMDVLHILRKQKQPIEHLEIHVDGLRADAVPAPFREIEMVFKVRGDVDEHKLQRAVQLAVEKYCSVGVSLDPKIKVSWRVELQRA
jgi:putative redox protein